MEHIIEVLDTNIVDLGAASVETQGNAGLPQEPEGRQIGEGICDD